MYLGLMLLVRHVMHASVASFYFASYIEDIYVCDAIQEMREKKKSILFLQQTEVKYVISNVKQSSPLTQEIILESTNVKRVVALILKCFIID